MSKKRLRKNGEKVVPIKKLEKKKNIKAKQMGIDKNKYKFIIA